jgi:protein-disulfide isomerase
VSSVLDRPPLAVPISGRDHVRGRATAHVTLLEYGDYQCPFCRSAYVSLKHVFQIMGDELRFAYRHFPLTQIHPHAQQAAEAAEAAARQGRFWEMHAQLFEHQSRLGTRDLLRYAEVIGLDVVSFLAELKEHVHAPRVRADFLSGVRSGVNGTPTFFINGVRHNGGYDVESLVTALRSAGS